MYNMSISWYSIAIKPQSGGASIFNGYFSVNNENYQIVNFYNANNVGINIINTKYLWFPIEGNNGKYLNKMNFIYYSIINSGVTTIDGKQYDLDKGWMLFGDSNMFYIYYCVGDNKYLSTNYTRQISPIQGEPSCFNEGTKILCLNKKLEEVYVPIENLKKGDLVKSFKHGYRKIDLIGKNAIIKNPENFDNCMYNKMKKNETNGLLKDLFVTGCHSVLLDELTEDELVEREIVVKHLLLSSVSNQLVKLENNNLYIYYHFTLENNGNDDENFSIWANGILTETISKNNFIYKNYTLL